MAVMKKWWPSFCYAQTASLRISRMHPAPVFSRVSRKSNGKGKCKNGAEEKRLNILPVSRILLNFLLLHLHPSLTLVSLSRVPQHCLHLPLPPPALSISSPLPKRDLHPPYLPPKNSKLESVYSIIFQ